MSYITYQILHVVALLVLTGYTFYGFAAPEASRKGVLIITGIASLVMLVSGIGLLHKLGYGFPVWAILKVVCWLGVTAMAGLAYRKRAMACTLRGITLALLTTAVLLVYLKPF